MQTIIDRIDSAIFQLNNMERNNDERVVKRKGFTYIARVRFALQIIRDWMVMNPDDFDQYITLQYIYEEIGYFLMDDLGFCDTELGREILAISNDLRYVIRIKATRREISRLTETNSSGEVLREIDFLLEQMLSSFDKSLHPNNVKLKKLGESLITLVKEKSIYRYYGELKEHLPGLLARTPN